MSSILINIGITIIIFISTIMIYNAIMKQPIFSIPWSNENTILKNNISQNIFELQNQIDKLSGTSNTDINNIKDNIIPSIQKTLEKTIEDIKKINLISNKDLQKQIDELNILLLTSKKSIEDSNTINKSELKTFSENLKSSIDKLSSEQENIKINLQKQIDDLLSFTKKSIEDSEIQNQLKALSDKLQSSIDKLSEKTISSHEELQKQIDFTKKSIDESNIELQNQLKTFSYNLQSSIDKFSEKTSSEQTELQKQIESINNLNKLNNEEIKLKIIPSIKDSIVLLENIIKIADDKITQNKNDIISDLNNLKNDIQTQIESQAIDTQESINGIKKSLDNLKNENETKIFILNTYTKDGNQIRWTVKGDDKGNLCISDTKNITCIDQETGFLFKHS